MPTLHRLRLLCVLVVLLLLQDTFRSVSSVVALGADVICGRIPGLSKRQRDMCRAAPDAMVAIGEGVRLGTVECQAQFRHHRWNCSAIGSGSVFGHVVVVGSREAAYLYAASSAGAAYAVAAACARGNVSSCGCDPRRPRPPPSGWAWGGCSADVRFATRLARRFLDVREIEGDARSLMNLHNNRAGRKAVKATLRTECKCHGVSGSCTMKTCWRTLPPFRSVGDALMRQYARARPVTAVSSGQGRGRPTLALRRGGGGGHGPARAPRRSDLVFISDSPNYCDKDLATGSLGTAGRRCNRTTRGTGSCDILCCGRGYNTHQYTRSWQCRCKFHWCCHVTCDTCSERTEEYTCK